MNNLYNKDFYKWTRSQVAILKKGNVQCLDLVNLLEEIESLGKSDKRALHSHLINLLMHMLKVNYQPEKHTPSWDSSISNARREIRLLLEDSPSLKNELKKFLDKAYQYARKDAGKETGKAESYFPVECPWKLKQILD